MPGRWGIFHDLQVSGRYDEVIDRLARELQLDGIKGGHMLDLSECHMAAKQAVHAGKLVCYVTEDDGSFRPLDNRIVEKLRRMDWYRQNCGLREWRQMLDAMARIRREQVERERNDVWDAIRRDPVFKRQVSDALWGLRPSRSIVVPSTYGEPHAASAVSRS